MNNEPQPVQPDQGSTTTKVVAGLAAAAAVATGVMANSNGGQELKTQDAPTPAVAEPAQDYVPADMSSGVTIEASTTTTTEAAVPEPASETVTEGTEVTPETSAEAPAPDDATEIAPNDPNQHVEIPNPDNLTSE